MKHLENAIPSQPAERRVFCNRTLNLRAIRAFGYDMDYTLIHYHVDQWEDRAYEHLKRRMADRDWPVGDLKFDSSLFIRGLVIDRELGNLVKANRFGYVKRACHGTRMLDFDGQRRAYSRILVDLSEERWVFLNTLFSQSEACMYAQLVDMLDSGQLKEVLGYSDLYAAVKRDLDLAHVEGALKDEIVADPDRFVDLDPELPQALLDQREAGRRLLLITNSDWAYTRPMMTYAFDRFLPDGMTWRELFHVVIVSARKPGFFAGRLPLFELATEEGLLKPCHDGLKRDGVFAGGDARMVETFLKASGDEILYVGDHIFADVHVSKNVRRWRTALVLRELEDEVRADKTFRDNRSRIVDAMKEKERLELLQSHARLQRQRLGTGHGPVAGLDKDELDGILSDLKDRIAKADRGLGPMARASSSLVNPNWGPLMRAGNDKSHLARMVEQYADVYTSRVSNFGPVTPFAFLRSPRGSLPHDMG